MIYHLTRTIRATHGHRIVLLIAAAVTALSGAVAMHAIPSLQDHRAASARTETMRASGWAQLRDTRESGGQDESSPGDPALTTLLEKVGAPGAQDFVDLHLGYWPHFVPRPPCLSSAHIRSVRVVVGQPPWIESGVQPLPHILVPESLAEPCRGHAAVETLARRATAEAVPSRDQALIVLDNSHLRQISSEVGNVGIIGSLYLPGGISHANDLAAKIKATSGRIFLPSLVQGPTRLETQGLANLVLMVCLTLFVGLGSLAWIMVTIAYARAKDDAVELLHGCPLAVLLARSHVIVGLLMTAPLGLASVVVAFATDSAVPLWWILACALAVHVVATSLATHALVRMSRDQLWKDTR